jgi:hypothetical protein
MDRNNGEDFDIDCNYLSNEPILVQKAKYCEENFLTPVNAIKPIPSSKYYCLDHIVFTDNQISQGKVGDIVNSSAILNAYYYNFFFKQCKNKREEKDRKEALEYLEGEISRYASLSGLEIDRAKREFEVKTATELRKMKQMEYLVKADLFVAPKKLKLKSGRNKELTEADIKYNEDVQICIEYKDQIDNLKAFIYKLNNENELSFDEIKQLIENLNDENIVMHEDKNVICENLENTVSIKEYELMNKVESLKTEKKDSIVRPYFMKWCGVGKEYKFEKMDCPMDYIEDILDTEFPRKTETDNKEGDTIPLRKIFINPEESLDGADRDQITRIVNVVTELDTAIRSNKTNRNKNELIPDIDLFNDAVELVASEHLKPITIKAIFNRIYGNPKANTKEAKEAVEKIRNVKT